MCSSHNSRQEWGTNSLLKPENQLDDPQRQSSGRGLTLDEIVVRPHDGISAPSFSDPLEFYSVGSLGGGVGAAQQELELGVTELFDSWPAALPLQSLPPS